MTRKATHNKQDFMWSARPSMKSQLHYILAPAQYRYVLINGFVVYTELAELAIFSWNMGGLS